MWSAVIRAVVADTVEDIQAEGKIFISKRIYRKYILGTVKAALVRFLMYRFS
ncbi:MAG: hypothetical protein JXB23_11415 [Candidatus Aminicenantes bacterium]|nr:hypothetical protein [Candidatus Aminicenantes bacterium]